MEMRRDNGTWLPVMGICDLPALYETVYAVVNGGCWHIAGVNAFQPAARRKAVRCTVSSVTDPARSVAGITALQLFDQVKRPDIPAALTREFGDIRGWSDCYGYVLVATGRMEAMIDPLMKPWDLSALIPIITEAGGKISGWNGDATSDAGNAMAGSPWGYSKLREIVSNAS
jgi:fructose-1,6-bisphosphatase/inositol monophosphatase family enzyme